MFPTPLSRPLPAVAFAMAAFAATGAAICDMPDEPVPRPPRLIHVAEVVVQPPQAAPDVPREPPDIVYALGGDRMRGKIMAIAGGKCTLSGPLYDGEVRLLLSGLAEIRLPADAARPDAGRAVEDVVSLVGRDHIGGEVTAITAEAVEVRTSYAGDLKVPRKFVRSVAFWRGGEVLLDSTFADGKMDPWTVRAGKWAIERGRLVCQSNNDWQHITAEVTQAGPVTIAAEITPPDDGLVDCGFYIFGDTAENRNSVGVRFQNTSWRFACVRSGNNQYVSSQEYQLPAGTVLLRMSYDPGAHEAACWAEGQLLGVLSVPGGPTEGKFVQFQGNHSCRVRYIRVVKGSPRLGDGGAGPGARAAQDVDVVSFSNGDSVSGSSIAMSAGKLAVQTRYGRVANAIENVRLVMFRKAGQAAPDVPEDAVEVHAGGSLLTLRLESMDARELLGASPAVGKVRIDRRAVGRICFVLQTRPDAPPRFVAPRGPPWGGKGRILMLD